MTTVETPRAAQSATVVALLIALLCLIWGSTWLAIKWGLASTPPLTGAAARFALAYLTLLLVGGSLAVREGGKRPALDLVLVNGVGQFTINYAVVYWAEQTLPSGLVAILWSIFPLALAGLSHWLLPGERLRARQWFGFGLAFVGVATLFWTDVAGISVEAVPLGLAVLAGSVGVAFVTIYLKRHGRAASSILLARDSMGVGAVLLGIGAFAFEREREAVWSLEAIGAIAYLALIGSCLTFCVYLWLLRWVEAYKLSLIAYVAPMLALLLGVAVAGEPLGVSTVVGSAIILLGVAAASKRRRAPVGARREAQ